MVQENNFVGTIFGTIHGRVFGIDFQVTMEKYHKKTDVSFVSLQIIVNFTPVIFNFKINKL
jgi:hypothetical protein